LDSSSLDYKTNKSYSNILSDKLNLPNFKEKNREMIELENTKNKLKELLPSLTDDDYFLDKKDSVVYSYLLTENVYLI
jgi:hypothetical protein